MWYSCILKVAIHVPSKWKCLLPIKLLGPLWTPDYYPSLNLHCAISRNEKYRLGPNYTETHTPRHKSCQVQKCSMILWESVGNLPSIARSLCTITYISSGFLQDWTAGQMRSIWEDRWSFKISPLCPASIWSRREIDHTQVGGLSRVNPFLRRLPTHIPARMPPAAPAGEEKLSRFPL